MCPSTQRSARDACQHSKREERSWRAPAVTEGAEAGGCPRPTRLAPPHPARTTSRRLLSRSSCCTLRRPCQRRPFLLLPASALRGARLRPVLARAMQCARLAPVASQVVAKNRDAARRSASPLQPVACSARASLSGVPLGASARVRLGPNRARTLLHVTRAASQTQKPDYATPGDWAPERYELKYLYDGGACTLQAAAAR